MLTATFPAENRIENLIIIFPNLQQCTNFMQMKQTFFFFQDGRAEAKLL